MRRRNAEGTRAKMERVAWPFRSPPPPRSGGSRKTGKPGERENRAADGDGKRGRTGGGGKHGQKGGFRIGKRIFWVIGLCENALHFVKI